MTVIASLLDYDLNMVESTCLRIDDVWSGLKFTHPKPGKIYANSYGTPPWATSLIRRLAHVGTTAMLQP